MARESSNIIQQGGIQTAFGTPSALFRKFAGLSFIFGDMMDAQFFRRQGAKDDTSSVINKEWTDGTFSGIASYVELCYVLASLYPYTVTPVPGVTGAYKWLFTPNSEGNDDGKFLTVEEGDDEAAERYSDIAIASLNLEFSRDSSQMSGNCFAKPFDPAFTTLTAGATALAERPIAGKEVDLFMDPTFGAIGTTKITDAFNVKTGMGAKRQPKWVMNTSYSSYKEAQEVIAEKTLSFTTEHNSQSRAIRAALKSNAPQFFQIRATGPEIAVGTNYSFKQNFCGKINKPDRQPDFQGLYGFDYEYKAFQEETMGRGTSFEIINKLASL